MYGWRITGVVDGGGEWLGILDTNRQKQESNIDVVAIDFISLKCSQAKSSSAGRGTVSVRGVGCCRL